MKKKKKNGWWEGNKEEGKGEKEGKIKEGKKKKEKGKKVRSRTTDHQLGRPVSLPLVYGFA